MPASEARIQANRLNAARSTGPKTDEGKATSRANAYKHGLTGSGVVASAEDRDEADELAADLRREMRPGTALGSILVERIATLAVRMNRCARHESAALAQRIRSAAADFDDRRADEADDRYARLIDFEAPDDPGPPLRALRRTPEGLTRLIEGWCDLASALRRPGLCPWGERQVRAFEALSGRRPSEAFPSRAAILSRVVIADDASGLGPAEAAAPAGLDAAGRSAWARERLSALVFEEVDELKAANEEIDRGEIEADRADAASRALFDASAGATLARRYEAAAERGFYRALREFAEVEAGVGVGVGLEGVAEGPAGPSGTTARGTLASFFPASSAAPERQAMAAPLRPGRVEPTAERPESVGPARPGVGPGGLR